MTALVRPACIVATFIPIGGSAADVTASHDHIGHLWTAAAQLGMDEPLLDGLPIDVPTLPATDENVFRLLAGRSHVDDDGVRQAYLFARHDVIGLCVALGSALHDETWTGWSDLAAQWEGATAGGEEPASILGTSRILVGHVDTAADELPNLGASVSAALRGMGLDAWQPAFRTADDAALWWWRDPADRRVVTVLSRPEREESLSRWLWWRDDREAADLILYQLNAAKLDYETRVHAARRAGIATSLRDIDHDLDDVLALHGHLTGEGRGSLPGLVSAQDRLISAQGASASVVIELTYLRTLRRTIGIARRNLGRLIPAPSSSGPASDSMFQRDQDVAAWLEEQIDQDLGYAEAVVARSTEAQALTSLRLQQASTRVARMQSRVTLMQTSLIGALLASVGVTTLLDISVTPPVAARLPLLAAFVALLLAAPVLAAHWFEEYGVVDRLAAMALGAALGWLVVGILVTDPTGVLVVPAVAIGALVALGLIRLHDDRVRARGKPRAT
ncbi:MAG: CATRA conflict system CASPASE/TPR repeat-associated protein [Candidatus Limnocylindrales bacterium]